MRTSIDNLARRRLLAWVALLGWSGVIWLLNTRPDLPSPESSLLSDILSQGGHLLSHALLAFLAWWAARLTWGERPAYWVALVGSLIHAALDEWVQRFVPTRDANLPDFLYDAAGVLLALLVVYGLQRAKRPDRLSIRD
jgi:VanZ family protein